MKYSRNTAVLASLGFGAIAAAYALGAGAPEPATMKTTRGLGEFVNLAVTAFGPTGAAVAFIMLGGLLAIVSYAICPSGKDQQR